MSTNVYPLPISPPVVVAETVATTNPVAVAYVQETVSSGGGSGTARKRRVCVISS